MHQTHSTVSLVKSVAGIAQSVAVTAGIVAGGIWFLYAEEGSNKANIQHEIRHCRIADDQRWIHVSVKITNAGDRRLDLENALVRIQRILPLQSKLRETLEAGEPLLQEHQRIVLWPKLAEHHTDFADESMQIRPGESDDLRFEFIIPAWVEAAKVYSYFERQSGLGWSEVTIHSFDGRDGVCR